jgi:hypothetical protein
VVALQLRTTGQPVGDLLHLPWDRPLEEWPDEQFVRLPRGSHRHVVRFLDHGGRFLALKELPPELAQREYRLLSFLREEGLPAVELIGVARDRRAPDGEPLPSVLLTWHLTYSLPYRHLFATPGQDLHVRLVDALVVLLVRIHLAGLFWGDCSLSNALFRRDAGALVAYLVDTETGEAHPSGLSDGQRRLDLDLATDNIGGGLYDLEAAGRLDPSVDPAAVVDLLLERYESLWSELTRADDVGQDELWRIDERLQRLNQLGFDTAEMELVASEAGHRIRPGVPGPQAAVGDAGLRGVAEPDRGPGAARGGAGLPLVVRALRTHDRRHPARAARPARGRRDLPPDPRPPVVPVGAGRTRRRHRGRHPRLHRHRAAPHP